MQEAKKIGIKLMTFDCEEELYKIKKHLPGADTVLRIQTRISNALYNLSERFGASLDEVPKLL